MDFFYLGKYLCNIRQIYMFVIWVCLVFFPDFLGPRLDFDPDIVAALDDDFDFDNPENILEDDFVLQANELQKG